LANIDCTVAQRTLDCYIGTILDQYCNIGHFYANWANVGPRSSTRKVRWGSNWVR